jgi:hypothetical protein
MDPAQCAARDVKGRLLNGAELSARVNIANEFAVFTMKGICIGQRTKATEDHLAAEVEIKDPMVLEFLGLNDEYSESALQDALIHRLEQFLLGVSKNQ